MSRMKPASRLDRVLDPSVVTRLIARVELNTETGCWDWGGYRDRAGYGQIHYARRAHWVHRVSYATFIGPIPEGMTVDHQCHNPSCVCPGHLKLATHQQNASRKQCT